MMERTEARVQSEAFMWHWNTYPNHRGRLFCVNNNPRNAIDGARLRSMGLVAGVSDMILLRPDRPALCIEFKTEVGRQGERQKWWQEVAEGTGCDYVIIRTLADFQNLFSLDSTN